MGLTLRQLICSVIAIGAAVLAYLTLEPVLGRETASWVCIVAAVPIAVHCHSACGNRGRLPRNRGFPDENRCRKGAV